MTTTKSQLLERIRAYPAALRWVLALLLVGAGVVLWHDLVWRSAVAMNATADEFERAIVAARVTEDRIASRMTQAAITALGDKEPLGGEVETRLALSRAIFDTLTRHGVSNVDVSEQTPVGFPNNRLRPLLRPNMRGYRAMTEIRFDAAQDDAFEVIADLESNPAVETISGIRMSKSPIPNRQTVSVQMTVEAWYLASGNRTGRGRL